MTLYPLTCEQDFRVGYQSKAAEDGESTQASNVSNQAEGNSA